MGEDNFSIFCIPRFEIVTIKEDNFFFSSDYSKGSVGTSVLISKIMDHFEKNKIPATIYLYGLGVISNERSENFNFPQNRPDLIICSGAIKPKVLIDVKYQEFTNPNKDKNFEDFMGRVTRGENDLLLCNIENYNTYITESKTVKCPIYIVKIIKIITEGKEDYHFLGIELSEEIKQSLKMLKKGKPPKEAYTIDYRKMLYNEKFFNQLVNLFKSIG